MASLNEVKNLVVEKLKAKGYAPNLGDVHELGVALLELIQAEVDKAASATDAKLKQLEGQLAAASATKAAEAKPVAPVTPSTPSTPKP